MLQLKKCPPFEAMMLLTPDPEGIESLYTIIKGTFLIGERISLAPNQVPIVAADKYIREPGASSIQVPSDIGLIKPATDVLLFGSACTPGGRPAKQMDVRLRVGSALDKTVRVFGNRIWGKGILGSKMSDAEPFTQMPLVWERAFGGSDATEHEPPKIEVAEHNPIGAGFRMKNGKKELDGLQLPNLENPKELIRSWSDRPVPAAFAPTCPHWLPRKAFAGTYDDIWRKSRAPFLPKDFNARFFQLAPPDQICPAYLRGGEEVETVGVTHGGSLRFRLPQYQLEVAYRLDDSSQIRPAHLDTVMLEADEARLVLLWRTVFPCDKKAMRVREIEVTSKQSLN